MLTHNHYKVGMEECGNIRNFYSATISGNEKSGFNDSFYDMLAEHKEVLIKRRSMLSVADPDEEE